MARVRIKTAKDDEAKTCTDACSAPSLSTGEAQAGSSTALAPVAGTFALTSFIGRQDTPTAALARVASHFDALPPSAEALDYAEATARSLRRDASFRLLALGHLLRVVRDRLWMTRGRYKNFGGWSRDVLGWSEAHANNVIRIAEAFSGSGVDVDAIGVAKLTLILSAPPEKQPELLAAAKTGASRSQLQEIAKGSGTTPTIGTAVMLGLSEFTMEVPLTRLGDDVAAVGFLRAVHGGGLQLAVGRDRHGKLQGHVRVLGPSQRS